jgi:flagellar transcriptional activator FlhD
MSEARRFWSWIKSREDHTPACRRASYSVDGVSGTSYRGSGRYRGPITAPRVHIIVTAPAAGDFMTSEQILVEIREANLSYLMLAQSLIRADREQALFRLGVNEDNATLIAALTPAQMMRIASGNTLLCRMRCDDEMVWGLLTNHGKTPANDAVSRLHASILLAGRHQEAA